MKYHNLIPSARGERGQSLVEFAIILPVFLLLLLGTVDLGLGFKTYIALTNAAREGARWISIYPNDQAGARARIAAEVESIGLSAGSPSDNGYAVSFSTDSGYSIGSHVTVNVQYEYPLLFGAFTSLPNINFSASSTMVVLYDQ